MQRNIDELGRIADATGRAILELSGHLDTIDKEASTQLAGVDTLVQSTAHLVRASAAMDAGLKEVRTTSDATAEAVGTSVSALQSASENSRRVASWVGDLDGQLSSVQGVLEQVSHANELIAKIAKQINILAINARIEAGRAGSAGAGFAVVADAINDLAKETTTASGTVTEATVDLNKLMGGLRDDATEMAGHAASVIDGSAKADQATRQIEEHVQETVSTTSALTRSAEDVAQAVQDISPLIAGTADYLRGTARDVSEARKASDGVVDRSERAVQLAVALGGSSSDGDLIAVAQDAAHEIGALFEAAIERGDIRREDLFSKQYTAIPGSDPEQVMAPFTTLTDRLLPSLQEPLTANDDRIVFCAAVDRNGYLPTHIAKFSQPQTDDPVWNAANCRNRRIFNDRVGLKAGRNAESFLMQTYRRDMGGGTFVLMKDLSAPIQVYGQHWGGFRIGFKPRR